MVMDLKTLYLLILGITITILIHTIFKRPTPIKEGGIFDGITKLIKDIKNIIAFICWFINFMRWAIESRIFLFKYINPLCVIFLIFDIIAIGIGGILSFVLNNFGLGRVETAFLLGLDGIDNISMKISGNRLFVYPAFINKMCYSCALKPPPPPPKPF
jgi:hypothetical protein